LLAFFLSAIVEGTCEGKASSIDSIVEPMGKKHTPAHPEVSHCCRSRSRSHRGGLAAERRCWVRMNPFRGSRGEGLGLGTRPDRGAGWWGFGKTSLMFDGGVRCSGKLFLRLKVVGFTWLGWIRSEVGK
jgi:hypothetical protein